MHIQKKPETSKTREEQHELNQVIYEADYTNTLATK